RVVPNAISLPHAGSKTKTETTMSQVATSTEAPAGQKNFPVSWDEFHRDARALAWRLSGAGPFRAVVAVTRGGLVPAAVVARELGIRVVETVCVASYEYDSQGEIQVLKTIAASLVGDDLGAGILIVDDLV